MDATTKAILWQQFGAAIDMLENAIDACPDTLWSDRSRKPEYWYVAYHTLFWLDLYQFGSVEGYEPPSPFTLEELDPTGIIPARPYTKKELKSYLDQGRKRTRAVIQGLTDEKARERHVFKWGDVSTVELLLYNMRHVQHHAAQLNLILRQTIDSTPGWVTRASDQSEDVAEEDAYGSSSLGRATPVTIESNRTRRSETMSTKRMPETGGLLAARPVDLAELIDYQEGSIVSRTLAKGNGGTVTLFAFDVGQALSEHTAPFDALVQVLDGEVELVIGGRSVPATAGKAVLMPADIAHAVNATRRCKILLTMVREVRA